MVGLLGHTQCGGVQALMQDEDDGLPEHACIRQWMASASPARQQTFDQHPHEDFTSLCRHAECNSVALSVEHLQTYPWVQAASERIRLHGWVFDIASGMMKVFDHNTRTFSLLSSEE